MSGMTGLPPAFTKFFVSAEQTITAAGSLSLAHDLGAKPKLSQVWIICKTAEQGYSVGDELLVGTAFWGSTDNRGVSVVPGATNIVLRIGSATLPFTGVHKTTGATVPFTNASWKIKVRAAR